MQHQTKIHSMDELLLEEGANPKGCMVRLGSDNPPQPDRTPN